MKYLVGVQPTKYFTEPLPSNIWGLYTHQIFDGTPSVKYLGAADPPNIYPFREIFGGCRPTKYLTEPLPSNIWGLYIHQIFDGTPSVKYLGAVHPPNI